MGPPTFALIIVLSQKVFSPTYFMARDFNWIFSFRRPSKMTSCSILYIFSKFSGLQHPDSAPIPPYPHLLFGFKGTCPDFPLRA